MLFTLRLPLPRSPRWASGQGNHHHPLFFHPLSFDFVRKGGGEVPSNSFFSWEKGGGDYGLRFFFFTSFAMRETIT